MQVRFPRSRYSVVVKLRCSLIPHLLCAREIVLYAVLAVLADLWPRDRAASTEGVTMPSRTWSSVFGEDVEGLEPVNARSLGSFHEYSS